VIIWQLWLYVLCYVYVGSLNFDLLTPKSDQFISVLRCSLLFWYSAVHNSRSMTPITWQAAVDDEEQRPLLQDILEAAVDDRRQLMSENSGHSCKPSSKQPSMGIMSRESSRGGDAPVTKIWRKSVNRYWRYRGNMKLPRESRMHGRTHGQRHGRTTRKHIASAGAYGRRRLKTKNAGLQM